MLEWYFISFSTLFQRWCSTLIQRWFNVDVPAGKIEMMRSRVVRVSVITSNIDMVMHCFDYNIVVHCILLNVYNVNCFVSGIFSLDDTRITKMFIFHLFFLTGVYCGVQVRTIVYHEEITQCSGIYTYIFLSPLEIISFPNRYSYLCDRAGCRNNDPWNGRLYSLSYRAWLKVCIAEIKTSI